MPGESQYLLVVYLAERESSPPVSPGVIARRLDRSPAATTEMLQRLETRGLLTYESYEGATLTTEGRVRAEQLHETYLVLVQFFRDVLGLDDYETEALQLVGTVSPTVTDRLAATLLTADSDEIHKAVPAQSDTD